SIKLTNATIKNTKVAPKSKLNVENLNGCGNANQWASPTCLTSTMPNVEAKTVPTTKPINMAIDFKKPTVKRCTINMTINVITPSMICVASPKFLASSPPVKYFIATGIKLIPMIVTTLPVTTGGKNLTK